MRPLNPKVSAVVLMGVLFVACTEPLVAPENSAPEVRFAKAATTSGPTVKAATPSSAPQNVTLDVQINGSGFDAGSNAQWLLNGQSDPRVKTNSTRFVSSTSLVANITISADAVPSAYDVTVTTTAGKKGIGTEAFTVLPMVELSAPAGSSRANDINESGSVVGNRSGGCNSGVLPVVWDASGTLTDLPLPTGFCSGAAVLINSNGEIVGTAGPSPSHTLVRWTLQGSAYVAEILGAFPGSVEAHGLNTSGHVFGWTLEGTIMHLFWWSPEMGFINLHEPATALRCYPGGMNDSDQIVGHCTVPNSGSVATYWSSPTVAGELLPKLTGYPLGATGDALNNFGIAAGTATKTVSRQYVHTTERLVQSGSTWVAENIGTLGGGNPTPNAINDLGWIAGSDATSGGTMHAFLWIPGSGMKDLGTSGTESYAWGMNNPADTGSVRVVGMSKRNGNFRAVVWRP